MNMDHHWVEGNLPHDAKCCVCTKHCSTTECLASMKCGWCGRTVRSAENTRCTVHVDTCIYCACVFILLGCPWPIYVFLTFGTSAQCTYNIIIRLLSRCPHYRGVLTTEASSHYRGVLTTGVSSLQGYPHYRGVLTTGASSLQWRPHYRGILTIEVSSLQGCPHYRGVLTTGVSSLQGCPHYRGVLTTGVSSLQGCPHYIGVLTTGICRYTA